jgi:MFS family permease
MIPVLFILTSVLKNFKDPEYKAFNIIQTIEHHRPNKNIRNIMSTGFMLNFFYSWMVVYGTIYLHQYIGFDFITSGIIFSIALIPFVVVQIPLGYLADKVMGEKVLLTLGFIIMGISTAIIPLIHSKSFIVWTIVLFIGRTGAAIVEVMNDTYFFKQVDDKNLSVINLYRAINSSAYIVAPLIAVLLLVKMPMYGIFYILGLLMIISVKYSLALKDTKINLSKESIL